MEASRTTYPTDLSDDQWRLIRPLIPPSRPVGADRSTSTRAVVNAILYRERSGCSWRMLPHDFPHWRTVYGYYCQWKAEGVWEQIRDARRQVAEHGPHLQDAIMATVNKNFSSRCSACPLVSGCASPNTKEILKIFSCGCKRLEVP